MAGKIILKKFPDDYPISTFLNCNDPANPNPFPDHARSLLQQGHCPACAEACYIKIRPNDYWELGLDQKGEIIVAYEGISRSVIYILNYERFRNRKPR